MFARMLGDRVAVLNPTRTTDEYNSETLEYPDPADVALINARLEQTAATEIHSGRDTQLSDWLLYAMPDAPLSGDSRVFCNGITYEVVGPPAIVTRPTTGPHHIEARLVTYVGTA
jgi:hypothetical protein